jgi:hypothetical protein
LSTVVGTFDTRDQAEQAARELRGKGFEEKISIVARRGEGEGGRGGGYGGAEQGRTEMRQDLTTGATTGAAIGGAGGLLAAAGMFTIPGIGPILALGPLAAGLTGAAAGGLVGGLVDMGIPRERGEYYEGRVRAGKVLAAVEADGRENDVREVFERYGASDINSH